MFGVLDRYIFRTLAINYLIALGSMMSLYVVLDMLVNMDEFIEVRAEGFGLPTIVRNIVNYYWPNLFLYFAQLSGAITLFACLLTLARMRVQNELTAILASGVSLYTVARPVLIFGVLTTGLQVLDTEFAIPSAAHLLARDHDDVHGQKAYKLLFLEDGDRRLLSAAQFHPKRRDLQGMLVMGRDETGTIVETIEADRAVWEPPQLGRPAGYWQLERGRRIRRVTDPGAGPGPSESLETTYPRIYESELSPRTIQLRQAEGWVQFLSLAQLAQLETEGGKEAATVTGIKHARQTAPILSLVLLLLGLPFFLDRRPMHVLSAAGKCLVVCGACYVTAFIAQGVRLETMAALPAWIPIFVFGTLSIVLLDRVRT